MICDLMYVQEELESLRKRPAAQNRAGAHCHGGRCACPGEVGSWNKGSPSRRLFGSLAEVWEFGDRCWGALYKVEGLGFRV